MPPIANATVTIKQASIRAKLTRFCLSHYSNVFDRKTPFDWYEYAA